LMFLCSPESSPTEIYTLSLHDALPISEEQLRDRADDEVGQQSDAADDDQSGERPRCLLMRARELHHVAEAALGVHGYMVELARTDRKSTRLNSSHDQISYAVFCLKKKK